MFDWGFAHQLPMEVSKEHLMISTAHLFLLKLLLIRSWFYSFLPKQNSMLTK